MACSRGLNVLVVDDDPIVREVLAERLGGWGHQTLLAADARTAVQRTREEWPDVVIADVVLPDSSGTDLLRELKEMDSVRPVILITAHAQSRQAARSLREGADDYLPKPVDPKELRRLLETTHRRLHALRRAHLGSSTQGGDGDG